MQAASGDSPSRSPYFGCRIRVNGTSGGNSPIETYHLLIPVLMSKLEVMAIAFTSEGSHEF